MNDELTIESSQAQETAAENAVPTAILEEMAKAGVLYGRQKAKTHPRMQRHIHITRNGTEIFDIAQTAQLADRAASYLASIAERKGTILFVGVTPVAKEAVKAAAEKLGYPYVTERWLGGTITNFKTIRARIERYLKLRSDRDSGRLEKYTKKERLDFDKELVRFSHLFGGVEHLTSLPQVLVIMGATSHETAIAEARRSNVPVVAVVSSDANPDIIDYPIPGNDRSRSSIQWILNRLEAAILAVRSAAPSAK
jgi:small subunit ribosomal protein S2